MNKLSKYVIINIVIAILFTLLFTFLTESIFIIVILVVLCALFYVFCEINIYKYNLMGMYVVHQKKKNRNWGAFLTITNVLFAFVIIKSANNHYGAKAYYSDIVSNTNKEISFTIKYTKDKDSLALIIAAHVPFDIVDTSKLQSMIRDTLTIPDSEFVLFIESQPNPDIEIELYNYTIQSQPMKRLLFSIDPDGVIHEANDNQTSRLLSDDLIWKHIIVTDSLFHKL